MDWVCKHVRLYFICIFQKYSVNDEGVNKPLLQIAYSKPNKRFTAKVVKEEKCFSYLHYIIRKIIIRAENKKKASEWNRRKRQLPLQIAPLERPDREETIADSLKNKRIKLQANLKMP